MSILGDNCDGFSIQQKISYRLFQQEQKVILRSRYPFLSPAQINCKVKDSWNKMRSEAKQCYTKSVLAKTPPKEQREGKTPKTKSRKKLREISTKSMIYHDSGVHQGQSNCDQAKQKYENDFMCVPSPCRSNGFPLKAGIRTCFEGQNTDGPSISDLNESPNSESPVQSNFQMFHHKDYSKSRVVPDCPYKVPEIVQDISSTSTGILKGSRVDDMTKVKAGKGRVSFSTEDLESFQQILSDSEMIDDNEEDSDDEFNAMLIRRKDDDTYHFDNIDKCDMYVEDSLKGQIESQILDCKRKIPKGGEDIITSSVLEERPDVGRKSTRSKQSVKRNNNSMITDEKPDQGERKTRFRSQYGKHIMADETKESADECADANMKVRMVTRSANRSEDKEVLQPMHKLENERPEVAEAKNLKGKYIRNDALKSQTCLKDTQSKTAKNFSGDDVGMIVKSSNRKHLLRRRGTRDKKSEEMEGYEANSHTRNGIVERKTVVENENCKYEITGQLKNDKENIDIKCDTKENCQLESQRSNQLGQSLPVSSQSQSDIHTNKILGQSSRKAWQSFSKNRKPDREQDLGSRSEERLGYHAMATESSVSDLTPLQWKESNVYITPRTDYELQMQNLREVTKIPKKKRRSSQTDELGVNESILQESQKRSMDAKFLDAASCKMSQRPSRWLRSGRKEEIIDKLDSLQDTILVAEKSQRDSDRETYEEKQMVDASGDHNTNTQCEARNAAIKASSRQKSTTAMDNVKENVMSYPEQNLDDDLSNNDSWTIMDAEYNSDISYSDNGEETSIISGQTEASTALVQALRRMKQTMADDEETHEGLSPKLLSPALSGISQISSMSSDSSVDGVKSDQNIIMTRQDVDNTNRNEPGLCEMFEDMTPPEKKTYSVNTRRAVENVIGLKDGGYIDITNQLRDGISQ